MASWYLCLGPDPKAIGLQQALEPALFYFSTRLFLINQDSPLESVLAFKNGVYCCPGTEGLVMMLGYDIRMEGEIKALFLHQAAPAGAALFLFLVAEIAVLLFALLVSSFGIWKSLLGEATCTHTHIHTHPNLPTHQSCVLITAYISAEVF